MSSKTDSLKQNKEIDVKTASLGTEETYNFITVKINPSKYECKNNIQEEPEMTRIEWDRYYRGQGLLR